MQIQIDHAELNRTVQSISATVQAAGGRALLVGGCVRDALTGLPLKDIDIEVFGIAPARLRQMLEAEFKVDLIGESFGVLKLRHFPVDVSIPRREFKSGPGHTAFEIDSDPSLSVPEAARRRDFTINAIYYDPLTTELLDPYDGQRDLAGRVLRHTSERFGEDPLRVLRGMQFVARFGLAAAPETIAVCRAMTPEGLAPERIFAEWKKLILQGLRPALGLEFLRATAWLRYYPELQALVDCEQQPEWHPEGDVWTHTRLCMDAFAADRLGDETEDLVVGLAVLCHDFGKPATTAIADGRIRSIGHTAAGEAPTRSFLGRMTRQESLVAAVVPLVTEHLRPLQLYNDRAGDGAIRRLACRVGRIDRLVRVELADQKGRKPMAFTGSPQSDWLLERARVLEVRAAAPQPIVMGRHLIELGLKPGPVFGTILAACYEAQLDDEIRTLEEGLAFAARILARTASS